MNFNWNPQQQQQQISTRKTFSNWVWHEGQYWLLKGFTMQAITAEARPIGKVWKTSTSINLVWTANDETNIKISCCSFDCGWNLDGVVCVCRQIRDAQMFTGRIYCSLIAICCCCVWGKLIKRRKIIRQRTLFRNCSCNQVFCSV